MAFFDSTLIRVKGVLSKWAKLSHVIMSFVFFNVVFHKKREKKMIRLFGLLMLVGAVAAQGVPFSNVGNVTGGEALPKCNSSGLDDNNCPDVTGFGCSIQYRTCVQEHGIATSICGPDNHIIGGAGCAQNWIRCGNEHGYLHVNRPCEETDLGCSLSRLVVVSMCIQVAG